MLKIILVLAAVIGYGILIIIVALGMKRPSNSTLAIAAVLTIFTTACIILYGILIYRGIDIYGGADIFESNRVSAAVNYGVEQTEQANSLNDVKSSRNSKERYFEDYGNLIENKYTGTMAYVLPMNCKGETLYECVDLSVYDLTFEGIEKNYLGDDVARYTGSVKYTGESRSAISMRFAMYDKNDSIVTETDAGFVSIKNKSGNLENGDIVDFSVDIPLNDYAMEHATQVALMGVTYF